MYDSQEVRLKVGESTREGRDDVVDAKELYTLSCGLLMGPCDAY